MYKMFIIIGIFSSLFDLFNREEIKHNYLDKHIEANVEIFKEEYKEYQSLNYFEGESIEEISKKLDKYLNSTLKRKGKYITKYSLEVGMDPYLATAVILQETGCYWTCSKLVRNCNNVGGNKGKPSCNGGSYRRFDTIEDGIKFAINKLNKYYQNGKTTPEKIGPSYATDPKWPNKVNSYIKKLKKA